MMKAVKSRIRNFIRNSVPVPGCNDYTDLLMGSQVAQKQIMLHYQSLKNTPSALPSAKEAGFRVYSQTDEDGLLLYIFSLIGTTNKYLVDIAFAGPYGSNSTNLIVNHNWHGLLVEGKDVALSKIFFQNHKSTQIFPPKLVQKWVTRENINSLIKENGFEGEIDLFSLDVDGMDYWLWESLDVISPRVVILEYQDILGAERSVSVPYDPGFNRFDNNPDFFGASLPAFKKLADSKGYRLVATNFLQYNAVFLRNDLGMEFFPELDVRSCFTHPKVKEEGAVRWAKVKDLNWQEI